MSITIIHLQVQLLSLINAWFQLHSHVYLCLPPSGEDILFLPCPSVCPSVCHTCFRSITEECLGLITSYLVCRLVMTSRRPLLILRSKGQRSRSRWPCELKNGFRSLTEERLGPGTLYLVCRLAMPRGRSLLFLSSVGLKARSQWPWAVRSQWLLCENNWRMLGPRNFILGMQDGHDQ